MITTLTTVCLLFGAFQALFVVVTLNRKAGPSTPSVRLLTWFLLAISMVLIHHAYYASMPPQTIWRYVFNGLAATFWFSVPPLYLLYVRSLLPQESPRITRSDYYLFLPAAYHLVTWLLALVGIYIPWYKWLGNYNVLYDYIWVGSYIIVGLICTFRVSRLLRVSNPAGPSSPTLHWLSKYTRWFQWALLFTAVTLVVLGLLNRYSPVFEYGLLVVFAVFALSVAYQSMRQANYTSWLADQRYGNAALSSDDMPALLQRLNAYLAQQPDYLNPDLRRADLAAALQVSEQELTQVFTRHLGSNFYAFINGFRLRAFEARLLDGSLEQLTMAALAQACGFKSKTSLYRVFREAHGTTPGAYLKEKMSESQ